MENDGNFLFQPSLMFLARFYTYFHFYIAGKEAVGSKNFSARLDAVCTCGHVRQKEHRTRVETLKTYSALNVRLI